MIENNKIFEVEELRDTLVMKQLLSNYFTEHGLCRTYFFRSPITIAQLNIILNFGRKLGRNWEEKI
jgi:hypothetical protein